MVFSSLIFLFVFFPLFLATYFIVPKSFRNFVLFIYSLLFYSWGEPIYIFLMIFSTVLDYTVGRFMDKYYENKKIRKTLLIFSVVVNLSMLGFFKYCGFFMDSLNNILGLNMSVLRVALPIGISFYTFQTMSYCIDLYRGNISVQKNIISFGAYVSMFPQLIAGPIVQYKDVEGEIDSREITIDKFDYGVSRFIEGLSKKVLLANSIGSLWTTISSSNFEQITVLTAWLGVFSFSMQLYFDFSGYSDMAIGLGAMLGFNFPENFNYPYLSKNASEFWRRWHMTLGTWFREYVYIPIGGNRVGPLRFAFNLLAVWFLTGLWHGASYNFILWGLYFGVILYFEKIIIIKLLSKVPSFVSRIYAILIVLISWVIFAVEDVHSIVIYLKDMFGFGAVKLYDELSLYMFMNYFWILMLCIVFNMPYVKKMFDAKVKGIFRAFVYITLFIICIAYLVDSTFNPFLYFRF